VLAGISTTMELMIDNEDKIAIPRSKGDLQKEAENENEDKIMKNIEQEIECPRCSDIMTLSSNFDKLGYICQECDLLLVTK
jgi:hypothetical protein